MSGCAKMRSVMKSENRSRSTASAPPAETLVCCAASIVSEPKMRISSLSIPAAEPMRAALRELEQISSAKPLY